LQRLGQMHRLDLLTPGQIRDGARQLEDAVIGARRQVQLRHGRAHQGLALIVHLTELPHLGHAHVGVADDVRSPVDSLIRRHTKSSILYLPRRLDAPSNRLAGLAEAVAAQLVVVHARHFDVDVDAVEQWSRDALLVFRDHRRRTGAGLLAVAIVAAWTGIHTI